MKLTPIDMARFHYDEHNIPATRLKTIKAHLEAEHDRAFSEDDVLDVAKLMYKLARMSLDIAMKEEEWERKLAEFPAGDVFEEKGYTCRLCGSASEDGMWYDRFGLKCLHCQKAVELGLIPGKLTGDDELFYTDYDLEYYFNVKGKTITAWIKQGILKARIIPHFKRPGVKHLRLFLMSDHMGFLPPKSMLKLSDTAFEEINGQSSTRLLKWYQCCEPFDYLKDYRITDYLKPVYAQQLPVNSEVELHKPKTKCCKPSVFKGVEVQKMAQAKRRAKRKS